MSFMLFLLISWTSVIEPVKLKTMSEIYNTQNGYHLKTVIPVLDTMPEDSSVIFVGYTPRELVFYVKNFQKGIHASSRRRDAEGVVKQSEDCFYILLATHGPGKDAYFIGVNPLGAVADRVVSPSGVIEWDGDIKVKTKITKYGWEAIIIVPFGTLSYNETDWGIDFLRVITGSAMKVQVLIPRSDLSDIINIGKMKIDFTYIKKTKGFSVLFVPSLRYTSENNGKLEGGLTVRWREGQAALLEMTLYPDYSELEADIQEFDLTQLPVDYPEKRPFFVEGRSFYTQPVPLIRTRNIDLPRLGLKFYSTTDKSVFTIFAINTNLVFDTSYHFMEFFRYAYNFTRSTRTGIFGLVSETGYNIASVDFTTYLSSLNLSISSEIARVTSSSSNFWTFSIRRNVAQGLGGFITFREMDSSFISPLNFILFNFDGVRWISGNIGYTKYVKRGEKIWLMGAKVYNREIVNKYNSNRIMRMTEPMLLIGPMPWIFFVAYEINELDYLKNWIPDITSTNVKMPSIGISYNGSTWKNFTIYYATGDYAGNRAHYYSASFRYSLFNKVNLGTANYRVIIPSLNQNILVLQFFGEISPGYHIFLKPYINVQGDCNNQNIVCSIKNRVKNINFIIGFEPSYLTGIYFAFNRTESDSGKKNKSTLKIQVGYRISF